MDYSVRPGRDHSAMEERTDLAEIVDLARVRIERLEAEELRAVGVGDHLPLEVSERVEGLRAERLVLVSGDLPPAA